MTKQIKHPLSAYLDTLIDAYQLIVIAAELSDNKTDDVNKKKKILYKATVISVCAAWESYLEAVTNNSLQCILKHSGTHEQIPTNVLARISTRLKGEKDERAIWKICGDGWKNEIQTNFSLLKDKFNTPRPDKVDEFVYQAIGLKNLSHSWKWKGQSFEGSAKKLNEFMDLRGDITHRLTADKNVYVNLIHDYINFLFRISVISSNRIRKHTHDLVKVHPWNETHQKKLITRV